MKLNEISAPKIETAPDENSLVDDVIKQFTQNKPTYSDVRALALKYGVSTAHVEEIAFSLLHSFLAKFGKHNDAPDTDFDAKELKKGIEVEHEHTSDSGIAQLIAKDHLAELPDYYSRLEKMEGE